ncbi:GAF and ANTAR domain-containing protein [Candidatus Gottesmanbacteria bacterium]|nr:GAF and ANTAR domain-containing protein [Candidatus Gottesmanbacteria bacterium]
MSGEEAHNLQKELAFLYRVARTVHSLELGQVLREIVSIAAEVTQADSVLVYLLDPKKQQLTLRASKNPHRNLLEKITLNLGEGITGWVAREKKPVAITKGARRDPRFKLFRALPEDTFEAFLSVPIINKRGVVGVVNVQHKKSHEHSPMEVNLLAAIGKLVGGAVDNALLIEETLELKEALELRKLVEKAKGILMKRRQISEDDAYKILQKESMDTRKSLKEVAEAIMLIDKLKLNP